MNDLIIPSLKTYVAYQPMGDVFARLGPVVLAKVKQVALFMSYAYSKLLRLLLMPIFETIWLLARALQSLLLRARQSWAVDNFSTQSWLDFVENKLNRSTSAVRLDGASLRFSNHGSQEFWRFATLNRKEPDTVAWVSRMASDFPTATLMDVGANIGIYSLLWMHKSSGKTRCLEPLPSNILALQRNLELNNFSNRAQIFQVAASDEMRTVCLRTPSMTRGEGFASIDPGLASAGGLLELQVPSVRLDSLESDSNPIIIKIDVEGAELEVVLGMTGLLQTGQVKSIIFEKNPRENEVRELLISYGFVDRTVIPDAGNVVMDLAEA
jgi:FkbM family methyltransferase